MTFLTYQTGRITYVVCPTCFAAALSTEHLQQHHCEKDWLRFMRDCSCPSCTKFRRWHDQEQGIG